MKPVKAYIQLHTITSVDYRLGPEHHYPAPLEDVSEAFCWIAANASEHGADLDNLVLAGESAGANLIMALAASTLTRRPEGFAQQVFDTGVVPRAALKRAAADGRAGEAGDRSDPAR